MAIPALRAAGWRAWAAERLRVLVPDLEPPGQAGVVVCREQLRRIVRVEVCREPPKRMSMVSACEVLLVLGEAKPEKVAKVG